MVVNGVPSIGVQVMCGSGSIGTQPIFDAVSLPPSSLVAKTNDSNAPAKPSKSSGATRIEHSVFTSIIATTFSLASTYILFWTLS